MNDILMQIRSDLPSFSKGQKRIANYILESYDKAAFMTASRLGKMVEVSESTVVRFAVELGFDGYPSMQKTLQDKRSVKPRRDGRVRAGNFEGEEHLYCGRSLVCCAGGIFELLPAQHV